MAHDIGNVIFGVDDNKPQGDVKALMKIGLNARCDMPVRGENPWRIFTVLRAGKRVLRWRRAG
jgi:hypothetical protein